MSPAVHVRRQPRPGDLDAIVAHHERAYVAEHGVDRVFVERVAEAVERARADGFPRATEGLWIVERDGRHAGSVAVTDEGDGLAMLRWVLLDPAVRGDGLGRRLIGEAVAAGRAAGQRRIALETFGALTTAGAIYRGLGFAVVRSTTGPRWGLPSVTYQRYELDLAAAPVAAGHGPG
ncbi:GNAT family N-acetyltransferase [Patulibacter defluvii]|uniref:GNAT family N-acetyltransferase n=1 Tax=Patulibacter defluvii TaxID=3095358 RepID=UPI002A7516FF|nr:GNAT family N-acetyltransferase [Patulibacter sp. DM4]